MQARRREARQGGETEVEREVNEQEQRAAVSVGVFFGALYGWFLSAHRPDLFWLFALVAFVAAAFCIYRFLRR